MNVYEEVSIELLQEVLNNFPDENCKLICFTIKSEKNGYEYTFSRVNNCWKCTLSFYNATRSPSFDGGNFQEVINYAEKYSGCPENKKLT